MYRKNYVVQKFCISTYEYVNVYTISVLLLSTFFPMSLHIKAITKICPDERNIIQHLIRYCIYSRASVVKGRNIIIPFISKSKIMLLYENLVNQFGLAKLQRAVFSYIAFGMDK